MRRRQVTGSNGERIWGKLGGKAIGWALPECTRARLLVYPLNVREGRPVDQDSLYRWHLRFPTREMDSWEARLSEDPGNTYIFSAEPGDKQVLVEAWTTSEEDAVAIREVHGGEMEAVPNQNWAALDQERNARRMIRIRDRFLVTLDAGPDFLAELKERWPERDLLIFPPDMAFGTGDHGTTSTCLRFLTDLCRNRAPGWSFMDLGTGTGILAIAGHRLGAGRILGTDYDSKAIEIADESLRRHDIPEPAVEWREEDALTWEPGETFDVVAANIFSTVLVQIMGKLRASMNDGGTLLVSGILPSQRDEVVEALIANGLSLEREICRGKWVTLQATETDPV